MFVHRASCAYNGILTLRYGSWYVLLLYITYSSQRPSYTPIITQSNSLRTMPKRAPPKDPRKTEIQSRRSRPRKRTQHYGRSSTQSSSGNTYSAPPPSSYGGSGPQTDNHSGPTVAQSLSIHTPGATGVGLGILPMKETRTPIPDPFDPVPNHLSLVHQNVVALALRSFSAGQNEQTTIVDFTELPLGGKVCDRCYRRRYACIFVRNDLQCEGCISTKTHCNYTVHDRWSAQPCLDPYMDRLPEIIKRSCDPCDQEDPRKFCKDYRPPCPSCVSANIACTNLRSPKLKPTY